MRDASVRVQGDTTRASRLSRRESSQAGKSAQSGREWGDLPRESRIQKESPAFAVGVRVLRLPPVHPSQAELDRFSKDSVARPSRLRT
jgi:hypothetical protein